MSDAYLDEQVAQVMLSLLQVRRALDRASFDSLLGALLAEIQIGLEVAEEQALEAAHRRRAFGTVVCFPTGRPNGRGADAAD